jgi:hypothetical protein
MPRRALWSAAIVLALVAVATPPLLFDDRPADGARPEPNCGLASPGVEPALDDVPDIAGFPGNEVVAVQRTQDFLSADLNVPMSVKELFHALRSRVRGSEYDILRVDFEGFEAELYIAREGEAGVFQILESRCPDRSRLLLQLPLGSS